jgi:cathepsin L
MKCVLFVLALVCAASALSAEEYKDAFQNFMFQYNKIYASEDFLGRFEIFKANLDYINAHNSAGNHNFTLGVNEFTDMSNEEFVAVMLGFVGEPEEPVNVHEYNPTRILADTVDWRTKGYVTGVKNQAQCGSCWSFSTTGATEGAHFKSAGKLVSLSEQNLMDCSTSYGNHGCNGGLMDNAFKYIIANGGIDTEASYPYTAKDGTCRYNAANSGARLSSYRDVSRGSESALQSAVSTVGPISVAIDASHPSFQHYSSGVYYESACSSSKLDHGVLVVGYGTSGSSNYWIVKNSWGASWGTQGYINMSKDRSNNCGIATQASYPVA